MSYYPDHVYFQSSSSSSTPADPSLRRCSVKGCAKDLSPDYALKMCEGCRGRHRQYATTKRAKRKQEKAAVGAQSIASDDGQVVTWMPQNHRVSLGPAPAPEDPGPLPDIHVNQIDPRLFNPTSSELAGALTLPPLDPSNDSEDPNDATPQADAGATSSSTTARPSASRYCSVKGCRNIIGGDYLFKMCVSCRNRYRGYGMTKRSKSRRGREVAAEELRRVRAAEDTRRVQQGLPPIGDLRAAERRAWERKTLGAIPYPAVVQYAPISVLPARMCTVSHCHTILQGNYPFRRCERHRLQNRHHSKLKRVRDKEVKSTPLGSEPTQNPESVRSGRNKKRVVGSSYLNKDRDLDAFALETEGPGISEDDVDESSIPPAARGSRRSNTVCSVKFCQNVLYHRSPWKMCETHREKDRMTRKRNKSGLDTDVPDDLDEEQDGQIGEHPAMAVDMAEEQAGQVGEHPAMTVDMESDSDPAGSEPQTPAPATGPSAVFMEPLLPPGEPVPTTQQSEMSNYPSMPQHPQQVNSLHPYGPHLSEAGEVTANLDAAGDVDIGISTQPSLPQGSLVEENCLDEQEISNHGQQDISSMIWGNAVSPASTGSDSLSSSSSSRRSAVADMPSSPATTSAMATPVATPSPGSTSTSHTQPQLQMSYYMPPPFSVPFTPGQPSFLIPGHYPPVSYVARPGCMFSAPIPNSFQTFQYAAPPPGPYTLRRYPYSTWGPYASGGVNVNWADANAQTHEQMQMQTQEHVQGKTRRKRGRAAASGEDVLRIVLVQPKNFHHDTAAASTARIESLTSTSGPVGSISDSCERPTSLSTANGPSDDVSSTPHLAAPADSEEQAATRSCSSEGCRRRLPNGALGSLCERCKARLKRRQEKTKLRLKLEPRKARTPSRRLES